MEFIYSMPVKVYFGKGCIDKNSSVIAGIGKRALIVTGKSSADKNGSLKQITGALNKEGIKYERFNRVEANPSVETVREAAQMARDVKADFIIGIGGGSPLDAAKAIAILASNDLDDDGLFSGVYKNKPLPLIAVPTTAGTGSEVTPYSILTFRKISNKKSIASPEIFPAAAFLDAAFTETLPVDTTINTAVDALSHTVEGYLSARATDVIAPIAIESMKLLGVSLKKLTDKSAPSFSERENLLYASMLAGMVIAHTGTTAVHAMGYPLTYHRDIDHGRANGLLMYGYLRFLEPASTKVRDVIHAMGLKDVDEFGRLMEALLGKKEEVTDEEIEIFTDTAMTSKNIANTSPSPTRDEVKKIFQLSFGK
jgi:alcohol dehydrogenase class IV